MENNIAGTPFSALAFFSRVFLRLNISPDNSITSCVQAIKANGTDKHSHGLSHANICSQSRQGIIGGIGCVQVSFTMNIHIYKLM